MVDDPRHTRMVFFDAAGTLFNVRGSLGKIYSDTMARYGAHMPSETVEIRFKQAFATAPPLTFPGAAREDIPELERKWWRTLVAQVMLPAEPFGRFEECFNELYELFQSDCGWELDPEAEALLGYLESQGRRMGVISNFDSRLRTVLDHLGIARYFESVTLATEEGVAKPNPEIFRLAMRRHGLGEGEALYVGDSIKRDVGAARAAGLIPVLIIRARGVPGWEVEPPPKPAEAPADPDLLSFRSLSDFLSWLKEGRGGKGPA